VIKTVHEIQNVLINNRSQLFHRFTRAMEHDEVHQLLEQMRAEHGEILAHPMMYVSALHNRQGSYRVNQDDDFFTSNGIHFLQLPDPPDPQQMPDEPLMKFVITRDESGTYRHSIIKMDNA
jgi:hypothetical protein